jgi:fatty acid desaturase
VTNQATTGIVEGPEATAAQPVAAVHDGAEHDEEHFAGRRISWIGTSIVCVGFVAGGLSFWGHIHWPLFWVAAGVALVGCLILAGAKTMSEDWY